LSCRFMRFSVEVHATQRAGAEAPGKTSNLATLNCMRPDGSPSRFETVAVLPRTGATKSRRSFRNKRWCAPYTSFSHLLKSSLTCSTLSRRVLRGFGPLSCIPRKPIFRVTPGGKGRPRDLGMHRRCRNLRSHSNLRFGKAGSCFPDVPSPRKTAETVLLPTCGKSESDGCKDRVEIRDVQHKLGHRRTRDVPGHPMWHDYA
jgi:hypothetical protein